MKQSHTQYLHSWFFSIGNQPPLLIHLPHLHDTQSLISSISALSACHATENAPCNQCQGCHLAKTGNHPDIIVFADSKAFPTDTKELKKHLAQFHRTALSQRRLVILTHPESYSHVMLNLLLKPLEESTANTRFVLISYFPQRLPRTIRSRCSLIYTTTTIRASEQPDELAKIHELLRQKLITHGPSSALKNAFLRLRDYYKIRESKGNEKLAKDVLVASVDRLQYHT